MTLTYYQKKRLNLALCEERGITTWKILNHEQPIWRLPGEQTGIVKILDCLPDHLHPLEGLGHCAAARKELLNTSGLQLSYARNMHQAVNGRFITEVYPSDLYYLMNAGPEIQVQALLRTVGKMPEGISL